MSPVQFDVPFEENEICIRDYDCLAWNDDVIDQTLDNAKLGSPVRKIINSLAWSGRVFGIMRGVISEFSEDRIKVSDYSDGELLAEFKDLDELVADGWAID